MVDAILEAARAQMREDGVAALNLNEVARRIGVTTPALYKYFQGKMALYDALFRLGTRLYVEELTALNLGDATSPRAGMRAALEHQLSFALRNPDLYQIVLQRPVPGFVPSGANLVEAAQAEEIGRATIGRWIARGLIAPVPIDRAFHLIAAVAEGLTSAHLANEPHLPVGEGRFGSLIPDAVRLFEAAWVPARSRRRRGVHSRRADQPNKGARR